MTDEQMSQARAQYITHLTEVSDAFNEWAETRNLGVRFDATKAISAIEHNYTPVRTIMRFSNHSDDGKVHVPQLKTAIDCFVELLNNNNTCGHVLGAMQSGKTTTSLALQWAGPVLYILGGTKAYPFYLISNQTNHEDQTKSELEAFLTYYGDIMIVATGETQGSIDPVFAASPTLRTYRDHILADTTDIFNVPQLGDEIHRRVGGQAGIKKVANQCSWATEHGYRPLMIIDEPQFGASDRLVAGDEGMERFPCMLAKIFNTIETALGTDRSDHWFIGLSATPFEMNDVNSIWEVRQYLTSTYSGFNFFNGRAIADDVDIQPPTTVGQSEYARQIGVPFLASISTAAYNAAPTAFARFARKAGVTNDQHLYRNQVVDAMRATIYEVLRSYTGLEKPVGLCIRAFNNNIKTADFIERLGLDGSRIEVLNYYGGDATGASIKRLIAQRKLKHLPYIIFVTSRARMADAFPVDVKFFMDFSQKASDLNALLQGLLGRACGYNKESTVVLSDQNIGIVDAYVATNGGYVHKTSRHSIAVNGYRRGAPTSMIKLNRDMDDTLVKSFFVEIDKFIESRLINGSKNIKGLRRTTKTTGLRTAPLLKVAEELDLFTHLEQPAVRTTLFPLMPTGFKIARSNDGVRHPRKDGVILTYHIDSDGGCRFTFRWTSRSDGAQGGAAGRARGQHDAQAMGTHMEPTIYVEKYDPLTNEVIFDKSALDNSQKPGNWRAYMVTFALVEPVREIKAADIALPSETCVYDDWMDEGEKAVRSGVVAYAR